MQLFIIIVSSQFFGEQLDLLYDNYDSGLLQNYYETINNFYGQILGYCLKKRKTNR